MSAPSSPPSTAVQVTNPPPARDEESVRRVQRTGSTSLSVTLPKAWTEAMNLKTGDAVRFRDVGEGRLELSLTGEHAQRAQAPPRTLRIDARGAPPKLLGRLVVGGFITGQEHVIITGALTPTQRGEVEHAVARMLGTSIVADLPGQLEIQNFIDPARYPLPRLFSRIAGLLRGQVDQCVRALDGQDSVDLERITTVEDEVDRVYLLLVRQLLVSSDNFHVAKEVGVPSHHFQLGYRLVAKSLEMVGDLLFEVGEDLTTDRTLPAKLPGAVRTELSALLQRFGNHLDRTLQSFSEVTFQGANDELNRIGEVYSVLDEAGPRLAAKVRDRSVALVVQRMVSNLDHALKMLVIVNEVTINKSVEPEVLLRGSTDLLRLDRNARS